LRRADTRGVKPLDPRRNCPNGSRRRFRGAGDGRLVAHGRPQPAAGPTSPDRRRRCAREPCSRSCRATVRTSDGLPPRHRRLRIPSAPRSPVPGREPRARSRGGEPSSFRQVPEADLVPEPVRFGDLPSFALGGLPLPGLSSAANRVRARRRRRHAAGDPATPHGRPRRAQARDTPRGRGHSRSSRSRSAAGSSKPSLSQSGRPSAPTSRRRVVNSVFVSFVVKLVSGISAEVSGEAVRASCRPCRLKYRRSARRPPHSRPNRVIRGRSCRRRAAAVPRSFQVWASGMLCKWPRTGKPRLAGLFLVGGTGLEPVTPSLSSWCSPN
jgi:hypothetical protein